VTFLCDILPLAKFVIAQHATFPLEPAINLLVFMTVIIGLKKMRV